jgi:hypothetical protein
MSRGLNLALLSTSRGGALRKATQPCSGISQECDVSVLTIKTNPQVARLGFSDDTHVARWYIAKGHPTLYCTHICAGRPRLVHVGRELRVRVDSSSIESADFAIKVLAIGLVCSIR